MKSPVEALQQLREEAVFNRRKLADQLESIQNVQAEIEAIDRAIADERNIMRSEVDRAKEEEAAGRARG